MVSWRVVEGRQKMKINIHNTIKRVCVSIFAAILVVTAVPTVAVLNNTLASEEKSSAWDGTFESGEIGKRPAGWTLVGASKGGDLEQNTATAEDYVKHYSITVAAEANSGGKSMKIAPKNDTNGTQGYVLAQSVDIAVEADTEYSFDYALKIEGVESYEEFFGGRVYIRQYDRNGKELKKMLLGNYIREDTEWEEFSRYVKTEKDAATVKIFFYLGGAWKKNVGIQMFVDDIAFEKIPNDKLLNGDFENGLYSWHLTSKTSKNELTSSDYTQNYVMAIEKNGYHGNAMTITRESGGYVSMDSNLIQVSKSATYVIDYALKIENKGKEFFGVRLWVQEYDDSRNLINTIAMHSLIKENIDWTELTYSYVPNEDVAYFQLAFWCGEPGKTATTFTAHFDDVRLTTILRNTSNDGVNNGNFEELYEGTVFDWTLGERDYTTITSTFEGYNGTKGIKVVRSNTDIHGYAVVQSNKFKVVAGEKYKAAYMARLDNRVGNVYIVLNCYFYDSAGKKLEIQRRNELDFRTDSEEWQQKMGYYTAPTGAVSCMLEFLICGTTYECWMDDVSWSMRDSDADIYGFETSDQNGNLSGWTVTQPAAAKLDKKTYREGRTSLFVSNTLNTTYTQIISDELIPLTTSTRYLFTAYIKSYNCNVDSEGVRLKAMAYDKNGKFIARIEGLRMTLNEDSEPSNWRKLICSVTSGTNIASIRLYLEVAPGTMNFWLDDISWRVYDANDEYLEDFDSVREDGTPDGWSAAVLGGSPTFSAGDSVVNIKAQNAEDVGVISTKWQTAKEYTTFNYTTTYATTAGAKAKITIKYYDYRDKEIKEKRLEKVLDSTGGEFVDYTFDFLLPAVKYSIIELSNEGAGTVSFMGIKIAKKIDSVADADSGELTWRGKWIWHQEEMSDSVNSTPRYFRYHVALPDTPAEGSLQITADDYLRLWINGVEIVDDSMNEHYANVSTIDGLQDYMQKGDNVIAVSVGNYTVDAGLLFDGYIETENGEWVDIYSTDKTVSNLTEIDGWQAKDFNDTAWTNCQIVEAWGGARWGTEVVFDASALVRNKFEVVDYSVTEKVNAGEEAMLTMTVVPEEDITANIDLAAYLWIRNSETRVMELDLTQVEGPAINQWKKGKEITVSYTFDTMDFIGEGKYTLQLDVDQVKITNMDIMDNKFNKAIRLTNDSSEKPMKTEIVESNGTFAISINDEIHPIMSYVAPNPVTYQQTTVADHMHNAGICITRACIFPSNAAVWTGDGEYNWDVVDEHIYALLSNHPDTYLIISPDLDVPNWWLEANPDEMVLTSKGEQPGVSFASEKFVEDAMATNIAMIEHMKEQPYWNRVIGAVLAGCSTSEWIWYGQGQHSIDHSVAGQTSWRKWLTEKYGTDEALRKAWNNNSVSLESVQVPTYDERVGDIYATLLDPATQHDVLDYADYMGEIVADVLIEFTARVSEAVDDNLILGSYYGYLLQRAFYYSSMSTMIHTATEKVLEDENVDFIAAPAYYTERYDGETAGFMHLVDGVLAHGKAIMIEDDLRVCSWENLAKNFFTRDAVGPTYNMSDSISQMEREFAAQITNNVGNWYFNLESGWFDREEFSDLMEILRDESVVNLAREKDCKDEVCFIVDEDMYENLAYDFYANYEAFYWIIHQQRYELSKIGVPVDLYSMTDLEEGLVPDHKVYIMMSPVEIDKSEQEAIEKYIKNGNKTVVWQYICGASDGDTFSAKNMSDVIGMDVTLDGTERTLSAVISNNEHWLTEGLEGRFYGNTGSKDVVSPTALITDSKAEILAYMSDNSKQAALAIKDLGDWTSIFSSVPSLPTELIRNLLKQCKIHMYSDNLNDVIFANSNYVAINCAYGGEKEIKLKATSAVYDVYGQKTYSLSTDTIQVNMEDNSTKLYRLTPVDKYVVYVDVNSGGKSKQAGYNEVKPGADYDCVIKAKDGYVISGIIVDGDLTEVTAKSYTVTFDDLNNSHFVEAQFKKVSEEVESFVNENEEKTMVWILLAGVILLVLAVTIVATLMILKNKNMQQQNKKEERNGQ